MTSQVPAGTNQYDLHTVILPLNWLTNLARPQQVTRRTILVWIAGVGYLGLMLLLRWQALRGQPLIAPNALTLAALAGLVGAVVAAGAAVVVTSKQ